MKYKKYYILKIYSIYNMNLIPVYRVAKGKYVHCEEFKSSRIRNLKFHDDGYCINYDIRPFKSALHAKRYIIKYLDKEITNLTNYKNFKIKEFQLL